MKLRFGIDAAAYERMRGVLDATSKRPPIGKRLSYVYLDTPEGELARRGVALRFRRSAAASAESSGRCWRKQWLWPKGEDGPSSVNALAIRRLKQRVDATFSLRIERWTWSPEPWADVSLDRIAIATGSAYEDTIELRVVCRRRHRDRATRYAVELGATHLVSRRPRQRGQDLLTAEGVATP